MEKHFRFCIVSTKRDVIQKLQEEHELNNIILKKCL